MTGKRRRTGGEESDLPMYMRTLLPLILTAVLAGAFTARTDTTDSRWAPEVMVAKTGDHCVDDPNCTLRPRKVFRHRLPSAEGHR